MLGLLQILQSVSPEVAQAGLGREGASHPIRACLGKEDLSPVSGGQEAGEPVERGTEVIAPALLGGAGVQRHAHPQRADGGERLGGEGALGFQGRREGIGSRGKGGTELVADRLEDLAAMGLDGGAEKRVMASEGSPHRLGLLLPEAGAALDVREEECDRDCRQIRHRRAPLAHTSEPAPA